MTLTSRTRVARAIGALSCVLLLAAGAAAERGHRSPGSLVARHAEELGLDDATQREIEEVVASSGERDEALREALRDAHRRMREILDAAQPDRGAVMDQADVIAAAEAEVHKNRLRAILDIRGLLSPEQRERLVELRRGRDRHHGRGFRACRDDLREHCADGKDGRARVTCLGERWELLSEACRDAFDPARDRGPDPPGS